VFDSCILGLFDYSISHFVEDWVKICYPAKKKVQIECKALPFDEQCTILEKVSLIPSIIPSPSLMHYYTSSINN
jgi:hypothetical protein